MSIDGIGAVIAGVGLALAVTAALALLWDRARVFGRLALVVAVVLSVAGSAALELNRLTEAYPSWSALAGRETGARPAGPPGPVAPVAAPRAGVPAETLIGLPGKGRLETYLVPGPVSRMSMPMSVYLPAAYFTPEGQASDFPVIEALHGYPGTPESWIRRLDIAAHLDREIAAGRMAPTVVLLPYQTPQRLLDTECTNLAGGPQSETYLTEDVPAWARGHLRIRTDRAGWGLTGYSAGAFCAMNLILKHPGEYAAAASLSGYPGPGITIGDHSEKTTNNIAWRLEHLPRPAVALWIGWADDDAGARNGSRRIAALAKAPITAVTAVVPRGGHSHAVWKQMEGPAFDWLSAHLARPVPRRP
jgi:S-formylglutathione hydrolase FrmB